MLQQLILHIFKSGKASATTSSHIHFGTNSDWYIRSGDPNLGKIMIQDSGSGIVQIGSGTPNSDKLQVFGHTTISTANLTFNIKSTGTYDCVFNLTASTQTAQIKATAGGVFYIQSTTLSTARDIQFYVNPSIKAFLKSE